jgi:hypothetical protein
LARLDLALEGALGIPIGPVSRSDRSATTCGNVGLHFGWALPPRRRHTTNSPGWASCLPILLGLVGAGPSERWFDEGRRGARPVGHGFVGYWFPDDRLVGDRLVGDRLLGKWPNRPGLFADGLIGRPLSDTRSIGDPPVDACAVDSRRTDDGRVSRSRRGGGFGRASRIGRPDLPHRRPVGGAVGRDLGLGGRRSRRSWHPRHRQRDPFCGRERHRLLVVVVSILDWRRWRNLRQAFHERHDVGDASVAIQLHRALERANKRGGESRSDFRQRRRLGRALPRSDRVHVVGPRAASGQELPANNANAVHVGPSIRIAPVRELRCTVRIGHRLARRGGGLDSTRQPEIGKHDAARSILEDHVLGPQIAVHDLAAVGPRQRSSEPSQYFCRPRDRERTGDIEHLSQAGPTDALGNNRDNVIGQPLDAVYSDDVRVIERGQQPGIARVMGKGLATVGVGGANDLDHHFPPRAAIASDVNSNELIAAELAE